MLVRFIGWFTKTPVGINTQAIASIEQLGHSPPACRITILSGTEFDIKGDFDDILYKLNESERK